MPDGDPPQPLAKPDKSNRDAVFRAVDRVVELIESGDPEFPPMIETLAKMFNDGATYTKETYFKDGEVKERQEIPAVSNKDKIAIAKLFADIAAAKEMNLAREGLGKGGGPKEQNLTINLFGKMTREQIDALPETERRVVERFRILAAEQA